MSSAINGARCLTEGEIAASVRNRREMAGMKQVTLAQMAGVTERTIQRLESGQRVDDQTLRDVAVALGLPEDSFLVSAARREDLAAPHTLKGHFERMVAYDRWANESVLGWMESHAEMPLLTRTFAHLVAENVPWLHILREEPVPLDINPEPDWTLAECRTHFAPTMDALASFVDACADADFGKVVRSSNPAGLVFEHTISEVLANLLSHSEHHRGQIVAEVAKTTGDYVPSLYMSYLRCRK